MLHTEAGFNDGLASPFVILALVAAERGGKGWVGEWLAADLLYGAGAALVLGTLAGFATAATLTRARNRALVSRELEGFVTIGIVLIIYGVTEAIGTYGLLAVFAAGFSFRRYGLTTRGGVPVPDPPETPGGLRLPPPPLPRAAVTDAVTRTPATWSESGPRAKAVARARGLQNRQGGAALRVDGSIPSPPRACPMP